ncbi:MAG: histidine--tRNA ligase [Anaerolineae bacterium]
MTKFQRPTGTQDVLPEDQAYWLWIVNTAREVAARYGCQSIDVPLYEYTELFARGVGAGTDIVEKEMFTFRPRPESHQITLRPEFTAGIARAYLQNGMGSWPQPVKLVTFGPVFRYERPQANRFRQHSQFNVEVIGESDPLVDFEVMSLLWDYFSALGLTGLRFQLNSIGSLEARRTFVRDVLAPYLEERRRELPAVDLERLAKNPLRVLDSKEVPTLPIIADAPRLTDYLDEESRDHFLDLQRYLRRAGMDFDLNPMLVRGLDYYTRTVFEVHIEGIGAQSALCGGGRYDGLIELLGGVPTPGVGFGSGIERCIAVLRQFEIRPPTPEKSDLWLVYFDNPTRDACIDMAIRLRREGLSVQMSYGMKSMRRQMAAGGANARYVGIVGDTELVDGTVSLKDMDSRSQATLLRGSLTASQLRCEGP